MYEIIQAINVFDAEPMFFAELDLQAINSHLFDKFIIELPRDKFIIDHNKLKYVIRKWYPTGTIVFDRPVTHISFNSGIRFYDDSHNVVYTKLF